MTPPNQTPRRPGSSPELVGIRSPDQPEREAVHHPGVEDAPQELPPHRKATLQGLGAVRVPGPPPLPLESAPTVPAGAHTARTQRAASPINVQAVRIETPSEGQLGAAPASADRAALVAALRDRDRLRAERDALARAKAASESIRPDGSLESLRKAQTKLYLGIAGALVVLAVPLGAYLTAAADLARQRSERAAVQAGNAVTAADSAKASAGNNNAELVALREEFRQYRANMREVLRLQGIETAKRPGDPDPINFDPVTPYCPRGKVCSGPQLILRKPP